MRRSPATRRRFVRTAVAGLTTGTMIALAGCSDPDGGEDENNTDGGVYRVGDSEPSEGSAPGPASGG
ncbi:MAG: hypothetical protein ACI8UR_002382 [Natronomonas sp.]|jgi:hypothetical protein